MAEERSPEAVDVAKIKQALASAGVLKSVNLSSEEEARIEKALAQHHVERLRLSFKIICHSGHYCIVVKGIN